MNCWKSCNISKDYGSIRLLMLSIISSLAYFILFYVTYMDINHQTKLVAFNFLIFIASIVLIIPVHKLLHCLPLWLFGKKATLSIKWPTFILPYIYCKVPKAVPKWLSILSVSFPILSVTFVTMYLTIIFPEQLHYFSVIGAMNFGLSSADIIYIMLLLKAPAKAYVEDDDHSFKILIRNQV